jgi:nitroimidazol reductase NimA-like FMN-containing flavoprotein (pyridoxamine 5'-phosphate oxidase superfamily)
VTDQQELEAEAKGILDANQYMTLGTADENGLPWVSPVWFAPASYREFVWVSSPEARHSRNIAVRPQVSIVVFDSQVPISTGKAVYMSTIAEQITDADDIERGMEVFSRKSLANGGRVWTADDVSPTSGRRLYHATAFEHFVLSPQDERLPVSLE